MTDGSFHDDSFNSVKRSVIGGSLSGLLTSVLLQPLDRLKTLSQQNFGADSRATLRTTRELLAKNGLATLWFGLTPTILRVVPGISLYFGFVQASHIALNNPQKSRLDNFLIGLCARSAVATLLHPMTLIKTRFESSLYQRRPLTAVARDVVRQHGVRGLWLGLVPTLLRDAPFSGIYLMFYREHLRLIKTDEAELTALDRFSCGISSGILACFLTQPFDVLKTAVQLFPRDYSTLRSAVQKIYEQAGVRYFFRGFVLRTLRRSSVAAINWTVFDQFTAKSH